MTSHAIHRYSQRKGIDVFEASKYLKQLLIKDRDYVELSKAEAVALGYSINNCKGNKHQKYILFDTDVLGVVKDRCVITTLTLDMQSYRRKEAVNYDGIRYEV